MPGFYIFACWEFFALSVYYMAGFIDVVEGTNNYFLLLVVAATFIAGGHVMAGSYGGLFIKIVGLLALLVAGIGVANKLRVFIMAEPHMLVDSRYAPNIITGCALCVSAAVLFFYAAYTVVA